MNEKAFKKGLPVGYTDDGDVDPEVIVEGSKSVLGRFGMKGEGQGTSNLVQPKSMSEIEKALKLSLDEKGLDRANKVVDDNLEFKEKKPVGRPKKQKRKPALIDGNRYQAGAASEIMKELEGSRVVPMYDMDPLAGGITYLTPLEHKFVMAFVQTGNASRAAEIASSMDVEKKRKSTNWNRLGYELFRRNHVRAAIGLMQKKVCVAAALDATEIISNIREIAAIAMVGEKFDVALKANLMLGEYLGMFGKTKEERLNKKGHSELGFATTDVFKSGEDLTDNKTDINKLSANLGVNLVDVTPSKQENNS